MWLTLPTRQVRTNINTSPAWAHPAGTMFPSNVLSASRAGSAVPVVPTHTESRCELLLSSRSPFLVQHSHTKQLITRAEGSLTKRPKCQKQEAQAMKWESSRNRCSAFHVSIKASDNLKSPADIKVGGQWSKRTDCMKRKKCPMEFVTCLP